MKTDFLLVGGTGYIGRNLRHNLKSNSVMTSGYQSNDSDFVIDFNNPKTFKNLNGYEFDCVILLAADINNNFSTTLNSISFKTNTNRFANFLEYICNNNKIKKLVFISSMTVYNSPMNIAFETSYLKPLSSYGLSKKIGEEIVSFIAHTKKIKSLILRIPGVYGADRKSGLIFNTIKDLLNNKDIILNVNQKFNWECIEINDLNQIIKTLLAKYTWDKPFEIFNIGYGESMSFRDTIKHLIKQKGSNSKIIMDMKYHHVFFMNIDKLNDIFEHNYNFLTSLNKYSKKTIHELCNR